MEKRWQGAHVGGDSPMVTMRVTPEEGDRLEEMRRELGLRSKSQVLRVALDLAEGLLLPGTLMLEGREGLRENEEIFDKLREKLGVVNRDQGSRRSGGNSPS